MQKAQASERVEGTRIFGYTALLSLCLSSLEALCFCSGGSLYLQFLAQSRPSTNVCSDGATLNHVQDVCCMIEFVELLWVCAFCLTQELGNLSGQRQTERDG